MNTTRRILTTLITASVGLVGCQKGGSNSGAGEGDLSSLCTDVAGKVSGAGLEIQGDQVAQQSEPASYSLSQDLGCSNNQKVEWTALSSTSSKTIGPKFTPSFEQSGEYVVSAKIINTESGEPLEVSQKTIVVGDQASIIAPDVGMAGVALTLDLAVPASSNPVSALWSFGDGKPIQFGLGPLSYTYTNGGTYTISVAITDDSGAITNITRRIVILAVTDGFECIGEMTVSGPSTGHRGVPVSWTVFLPPCMVDLVHHVGWTFSDGAPSTTGLSATRTYDQVGTFNIKIEIFNDDTQFPLVTLNRQIEISEPPPPPDEDPLNCPVAGSTRDVFENQIKETAECGVLGSKDMTYRDHVVQTCQATTGTSRRWVETTRVKELVQEGECTGQYCPVPSPDISLGDVLAMGFVLIEGKYYIADGGSQGFYPSQTPAGLCVKQSRTCDNGVLSGNESAIFLTCKNGCEGLGPDGTVRTGVVTGEETIMRQCSFGETGINDKYTTLADQLCANGEVTVSNQRRGTLISAGVCPTYSWVPTENWSTCSADCGGQQSLVHECRDNNGEVSSDERCVEEAPVQTQVCDGNPEAVRTTESVTHPEDAGSSNTCPKNQIGVITKSRDVTTTKTYACIDHSIQLEAEKVEYGEWQVENYCRDYVATRCSQDSLSNADAKGRYAWMVKCKDQVPMLAEFIEKFDNVKGHGNAIDGTKRVLYPTFMNRAKKPEVVWKAPKKESDSCVIPSTVYIAAVCLSSCATPEQQILSQSARGEKVQYSTFLEALTQNHKYVATLRSESNLHSRSLQATKVEQWVTEMMDSEHDILNFQIRSGGTLRLTPNHPIVTSYHSLPVYEWKIKVYQKRKVNGRDTWMLVPAEEVFDAEVGLVDSRDLTEEFEEDVYTCLPQGVFPQCFAGQNLTSEAIAGSGKRTPLTWFDESIRDDIGRSLELLGFSDARQGLNLPENYRWKNKSGSPVMIRCTSPGMADESRRGDERFPGFGGRCDTNMMMFTGVDR